MPFGSFFKAHKPPKPPAGAPTQSASSEFSEPVPKVLNWSYIRNRTGVRQTCTISNLESGMDKTFEIPPRSGRLIGLEIHLYGGESLRGTGITILNGIEIKEARKILRELEAKDSGTVLGHLDVGNTSTTYTVREGERLVYNAVITSTAVDVDSKYYQLALSTDF